jgi:hypothetical protein
MRVFVNIVALVLTFSVATVLGGWWTVPLVSGLWTLAAPRRAAVLYATFAAVLAWGALLVWTARGGPVGAVDRLLAQIMNLPSHAMIGLTLLYAALLAGSAALLAQAIRPPTFSRTKGTSRAA